MVYKQKTNFIAGTSLSEPTIFILADTSFVSEASDFFFFYEVVTRNYCLNLDFQHIHLSWINNS